MHAVMDPDGVTVEMGSVKVALEEERALVAQRLGMKVQGPGGAEWTPRSVAYTQKKGNSTLAAEFYPEWSGMCLKVWQRFMPTCYRSDTHYHFYDYRFDQIPCRALKAIEAAQETGAFNRIEIWTPERGYRVARFPDPVAVGVVVGATGTKRYFPIVKWGEAEIVSTLKVWRVGLWRLLRWSWISGANGRSHDRY
jgi:hypothetical protein